MTNPITVTLGQIAALKPCDNRWRAALGRIGMTPEDFDPERAVSIGDVAITCGPDDALWLLQLTEPRTKWRCAFPCILRGSAHSANNCEHNWNAAMQRWLDGDDSDRTTAAMAAVDGVGGIVERFTSVTALAAARGAGDDRRSVFKAAWDAERARQLTDLLAVVGSTIPVGGAQ